MPDTTQRIDPADVIGGRYRILDEIGRGGMATVLRARDELLGREVAIKLLHGHLAEDEAFLDRFRREARAAAALSHPNVVALYDWGENADGSYMVLELVEGPSLRDVLRIRGRVTPGEALALLGPAAAGLHRAHRAGLVHRDVKPENVLVDAEGAVKVTDFGLARAAASSTQTFGPDVIVGSPHYLSPEAVHGLPVDARADVYALGVLLYEMLTGRPPYEGETPLATALQHTTSEVPRPSTVVPGLPPALDEVVLTATAADPELRYRDAGAFGAALAAAVPDGPRPVDLRDGERSTVVIPVGATDTMVPPAAHRFPGAAAGAADAETTMVAVDGDDAGPRRRRGRRALLLLVALAVLAAGAFVTWDVAVAPVTDVPSVVGMEEDAARRTLEDAGFTVAVDPAIRFDREVPEGRVVRQDPADTARRGASVLLTLSAGPRQVTVPDLGGRPEEEAREALRVEGLENDVERVHHEELEAGSVVGTEPAAGEVVDEGATVTLLVSQGPRPIAVPDLRGRDADAAVAELRELGLEGTVVDRVFDPEVPEGAVVRQEPADGEFRFRGESVELVVSRGPQPFEMPDVRDMTEQQAVDTLEGLGLEVRVEHVDTLFRWRAGDVQEQDPRPGRLVRPGDTVTLFVWR